MWKPTVLYWLVALAFLVSMWRRVSDRPLVQRMFGAVGELPDMDAGQWRRLNWSSVVFFAVLGAANVAIFRNFDESTWVTFKLAMFGIILAFVVAQGFWIASRAESHDEPAG
jgi:intracellular septation protein